MKWHVTCETAVFVRSNRWNGMWLVKLRYLYVQTGEMACDLWNCGICTFKQVKWHVIC